jgi:UDP-2,3-diacylglucosamine pyrophosphatase LpxH
MVQCSKTDSSRFGFGRLLLLVSALVLLAGAEAPARLEQHAIAGATDASAVTGEMQDASAPASGSPGVPAPSEATPTTYYFISDLHIGGDAGLDQCRFEKELIAFLQKIAEGPQPAELIIVGDAFGMWELTDVPRTSKLARIASTHQDLFAQFRETGRRMKITLLPGNHDYELACEPSYKTELAQWNIVLEPVIHITREVAGRKIWIEHGNQHDAFNRFPDFGNPYGLPGGYFITTHTVTVAAESAARAQSPWLNDVESVYPNEEIPAWIWSNYFYREMTPLLRSCLLPFLLLFSLSVVVFAGRGLERFGILPTRVFHTKLSERFGLKGRLIDWVFWVNGVVISFLLVMAVPGYLLAHDVRSALRRYGVEQSEGLKIQKESKYLAAAEDVFKADPAVAVYVYGHTHAVSMRKVGSRYVINTGTWLKRLEHVPARSHLLPGVFYPSHRLNYFTISGQGKNIRINYEIIPNKPPSGLTWLESLMILGRRPSEGEPIPAETIFGAE